MCSESPCESCFVTYLLGPAGTECRLKGRFSLPLGLKVKRWVKVGPEKTAFLNLLKPSYSYVSFYSTYWGYQLKDYISFARQLHEERPLYNRFRRLAGLFSHIEIQELLLLTKKTLQNLRVKCPHFIFYDSSNYSSHLVLTLWNSLGLQTT